MYLHSIYPNNSRDVLIIYLFGLRLHGIDKRKLEKNTGIPRIVHKV